MGEKKTDGRNFQVEYALKAVENAGTSIGIKCKDGVVFAVEKIISSKLLLPGANKRLQTIDKHVGVVCIFVQLTRLLSVERCRKSMVMLMIYMFRLARDYCPTEDTL